MYLKSIPYIFCDFRVYIPWNFTLKWWYLLELNRKHILYLYLEQSMSNFTKSRFFTKSKQLNRKHMYLQEWEWIQYVY